MLTAFGLIGASGGEIPGSFDLISTTILSSNVQTVSFDVSSLASTYKHLQFRITAKCNRSDIDVQNLLMRFNGSSSSYTSHDIRGNGSAIDTFAYSGYSSAIYIYPMTGNLNSNVFGAGVYDVIDPFSTTKNKVTRGNDGIVGSFRAVGLRSGSWSSTSAVSSISFTADDAMYLLTGSRFSLYGIKG